MSETGLTDKAVLQGHDLIDQAEHQQAKVLSLIPMLSPC